MQSHRTADSGRPTLRVLEGGQSIAALAANDEARDRAALELVSGVERAIACLHPDDLEEMAWYRARLHEARTAAGLPVLQAAGA